MKRRTMWMSVIALAISLLAADIGQAQQKGRQRGDDRGGRSRGGFGGIGGSVGSISLIGNEKVQKELELSQTQIAAVAKLTEAYREEQRSASGERPDFSSFRDLSNEERRKRFEEMGKQRAEAQAKLNAKFNPKVAELLDPPQADRLDQIVLQLKGMAALLEADTSKLLGLSEDQKKKIASLNTDYDNQRRELFGGQSGFGGNRNRGQGASKGGDRGKRGGDRGKRGGDRGKRGGDGGGFGEAFAKMRELGEKRDANVMAVLTADQKKMFADLKGKPIDRQSLLGGFGGRSGGDRNRGGGGDRGKRGKRPAM